MRNTVIIIFSLVTLNSFAQCEDLLIGKWVFKDVIKTENLDQKEQEEINKFKKTKIATSMYLDFKKINGGYGEVDGVILSQTLKEAAWDKINCSLFQIYNEMDVRDNYMDSWDLLIIKVTENELIINFGIDEAPPHFLFVKSIK